MKAPAPPTQKKSEKKTHPKIIGCSPYWANITQLSKEAHDEGWSTLLRHIRTIGSSWEALQQMDLAGYVHQNFPWIGGTKVLCFCSPAKVARKLFYDSPNSACT